MKTNDHWRPFRSLRYVQPLSVQRVHTTCEGGVLRYAGDNEIQRNRGIHQGHSLKIQLGVARHRYEGKRVWAEIPKPGEKHDRPTAWEI